MSAQDYDEYIIYDMIYNLKETDKNIIIIYKPNEDKKIKKEKIKILKEQHGFYLDDEKEYNENVVRIFGKYFVKQNRNKCKIIYNNNKYKLKEFFDEIDENNNKEVVKLKLNGINNINNLEKMFYGCYHLSLILDSKNNNENEKNNINKSSNIYEKIKDMTKSKITNTLNKI